MLNRGPTHSNSVLGPSRIQGAEERQRYIEAQAQQEGTCLFAERADPRGRMQQFLNSQQKKEEWKKSQQADLQAKRDRRMQEQLGEKYDDFMVTQQAAQKEAFLDNKVRDIREQMKANQRALREAEISEKQRLTQEKREEERINDQRLMKEYMHMTDMQNLQRNNAGRYRYIAEKDQPKNETTYEDERLGKDKYGNTKEAKINDHQVMPGMSGIFGSKNAPTEMDLRLKNKMYLDNLQEQMNGRKAFERQTKIENIQEEREAQASLGLRVDMEAEKGGQIFHGNQGFAKSDAEQRTIFNKQQVEYQEAIKQKEDEEAYFQTMANNNLAYQTGQAKIHLQEIPKPEPNSQNYSNKGNFPPGSLPDRYASLQVNNASSLHGNPLAMEGPVDRYNQQRHRDLMARGHQAPNPYNPLSQTPLNQSPPNHPQSQPLFDTDPLSRLNPQGRGPPYPGQPPRQGTTKKDAFDRGELVGDFNKNKSLYQAMKSRNQGTNNLIS